MKRAAQYDKGLEVKIQSWMESTLGEKFAGSFSESLKDGVLLCKLLNTLKPGSAKPGKPSKMPFVQMENINNFLTGCKNCGLSDVDLFVTVDLYEAKNMLQVQHCLDKLRVRFGGESFTALPTSGSDVFNSPTLQEQLAPAPAVAAAPAAPAAPAGSVKFCPECGAATNGGKFCAECGCRF